MLYVDGQIMLYSNVSSGSSLGELVVGTTAIPAMNISSFHGYVDNVFIYNTALAVDELDFLR